MHYSKPLLEKLRLDQILDLSNFVVSENFNHHMNDTISEDFERDVKEVYEEELNFYKESEIFVIRDYSKSILGAIRVLNWNYIDELPLEKIFNIYPLSIPIAKKANNIYHIGRFAIKKEAQSISLFKKLMMYAISPICAHKRNVAFAECDSKLLRTLTLLGINTTIIGKPIHYLGSKTIPISMDYSGLIRFYEDNLSLITDFESSYKKKKLITNKAFMKKNNKSEIYSV